MIEIDRLDSLGGVPQARWNDLVGTRSFYLSHQWLAAQDAGQPVAPRYLIARSGGELVGALPTYLVQHETNEFYEPARCADGRWTGRYLLAGTRRAYTNDVLVRPDLAVGDQRDILRALVEAALDRAEQERVDGVLFLYLGTAAAGRLHAAYPAAHPLLTTAEAILDLPGDGFDDYLGALADKRRREVRREMARFTASGLTVAPIPVDEHWQRLAELFGNVQHRYGHRGDAEQWRRVVQRQTVRVAADTVILGCLAGDELLGGVVLYPWRGGVHVKLVGFDYPRLKAAYEYFNLVYYAVIRYAYRHRLSSVHFGREAIEAKLRRGARAAPLWSVALARGEAGPPDGQEWNAEQGRRWRDRYPWARQAFADPGWSSWGCAG